MPANVSMRWAAGAGSRLASKSVSDRQIQQAVARLQSRLKISNRELRPPILAAAKECRKRLISIVGKETGLPVKQVKRRLSARKSKKRAWASLVVLKGASIIHAGRLRWSMTSRGRVRVARLGGTLRRGFLYKPEEYTDEKTRIYHYPAGGTGEMESANHPIEIKDVMARYAPNLTRYYIRRELKKHRKENYLKNGRTAPSGSVSIGGTGGSYKPEVLVL